MKKTFMIFEGMDRDAMLLIIDGDHSRFDGVWIGQPDKEELQPELDALLFPGGEFGHTDHKFADWVAVMDTTATDDRVFVRCGQLLC